MKAVLAIVLFLFASDAAAQPEAPVPLNTPLVADLSQHSIEIRSDFNGTQLLIFGARNVPGDLVIAVRGPMMDATLRRKARIAGMWMHVDQRHYYHLPSYYALASTKPLNRIAPPALLQSLGLGERRMIAASNPVPHEKFDTAIGEVMVQKRWWKIPSGAITYFGESLFKTRIDFPDNLPSGQYTADIFLFARGKLIGMQTIPIQSYKTGFDARIADMAKHQGALYGLFAVIMALFGGGLGHRLFNRLR